MFHLQWCWVSLLSEVHLVNETDAVLAVTLRRRGYLGETAFVSILVEGRTAVSGEDFRDGSLAQVQFSPSQSEATWLLHLQDDLHYEREEELFLRLRNPISAVLEPPHWATITIRDPEDESTVFFPTVEYKVEEDSGEVLIQVERTGDLSTELVVQCITENDSAMGTNPLGLESYSDYISRLPGLQSTLKFSSGQQRNFCRITLIDDSLQEPEERFWVRLTNPLGGHLGQHSAQVIILADSDDAPVIYFNETLYHVDESADHVEVVVRRSGADQTRSASVVVRSKPSSPVSAKVGYDYVGVGQTLDFAPGVEIMTLKVIILDDLGQPHLEGPESFLLVLGMPSNAALGHPEETTIIISDSISDLPTVQFQQGSYTILEEAGELHVPVWRSGDLSQPSTVRCYTRQGSATAGVDFLERPDNNNSLLLFQAGEVTKNCVLTIVNDSRHEANETLQLVLGSPSSKAFGSALLGSVNSSTVTILDYSDQPVIRFGRSRITVKEPEEADSMEIVEVPVVRQGDLSQVSIVRVHTKDGSARSGQDYVGKSSELIFHQNVSKMVFEVGILYDQEKEIRETFTVHLKPDEKKIAKIKDHRLIVYIQEHNIMADVTFPAPPIVVSLRDYDNAAVAAEWPIGGYPVVCITACNPKYPDFHRTGGVCISEGINNNLTEFRWQVAAPWSRYGVLQEMRDLTTGVFFTSTQRAVLDSIYFSAGSQVRCAVRAVNTEGEAGLEVLSRAVTISQDEGLCLPQVPETFGAEPFTAKLKYTGSEDPIHPNLIRLTVAIPHHDGMLPTISTRPLSNFELILGQDSTRIGIHKCSNLLDYTEVETKYGFVSNLSKNTNVVGEMEPYQYSTEMRSESTLRFYQNLDLEACLWSFESYYTMSELITECGGRISTESHLTNLVQSSMAVDVPLHISYVFHAAGLHHSDLCSHLRLIFVYDSAILWQHGIIPPNDSHNGGHLFPTKMNIASNGRLVVHFRTEASFRGLFVLSHSQSSAVSTVASKDHSDVTYTLHLVKTEPTFAQPEQEWEFTSDMAVRDYSGMYTVKLIPCVVLEDIVYSSTAACNPQDPLSFELRVRFQQVSDPVPSRFSLDTHFYLAKQQQLWFYNGSAQFQEALDAAFQQGDRIYGRIMVDPVQNLGDSIFLSIEKCFVCAGVDGYVPKYNPSNNEFGCIIESPNLLYSFKIIDRTAPSSVVFDLKSIPFNAKLVSDDQQPDAKHLLNWQGSDGFSFSPDPLFQASQGRQWFIHCIFTVKSQYRMAKHFHKRSVSTKSGLFRTDLNSRTRVTRDTEDAVGVGEGGRGTNLHRIELQPFSEKSSSYTDVQKFNSESKFHLWWLSLATSVFAAVLLIVTVWVVVCKHNNRITKRETKPSEMTRSVNDLTIICGSSRCRSSLQNFTNYHTIPSNDSTAV